MFLKEKGAPSPLDRKSGGCQALEEVPCLSPHRGAPTLAWVCSSPATLLMAFIVHVSQQEERAAFR